MDAVTARRWSNRCDGTTEVLCLALAQGLGLDPLTARILIGRGVTDLSAGRSFLASRLADLPDPFLMQGMTKATARLATALERGEKIAIHGDYDVDGISGTSLLVHVLRQLGAEVEYHIPLRLKDGYGLSAEALRLAASGGVRVAVSVDCGVSAVAEAKLARELGLDLIITDHHQVPQIRPEALAILNPHQVDCAFPAKELAGVGVAFMLLVGLRKVLRERGYFRSRKEPDLRLSLDLVALGTIADIAPLQGLNRTLTKLGLQLLNESRRPGVQALREVAGVKEVSCSAVGFRLAPRLNAAGRLEDAALGVQLLLTESVAEAKQLAALLDGFNRERQALEQETLRQAIERLDGLSNDLCSIVLADERWHPGVIGIVASRLVERYGRPTVLIALEEGKGKGSGRSIRGFHLYQALADCAGQLLGFGGHEYAAGLSLEMERVEAFAREFEALAKSRLSAEDLQPQLWHDGEVLIEELGEREVVALEGLAPFGAGNPEPCLVLRGVRVQQLQPVGQGHLRFTARQGGYSLACIAFGLAERAAQLQGEIDLLGVPGLNEWRNQKTVQLRVKDFRPAD
ncbi:MAG: single-stranded-DNA-specific exonuclease RecJ [Trichloromonadaceae bacterium]